MTDIVLVYIRMRMNTHTHYTQDVLNSTFQNMVHLSWNRPCHIKCPWCLQKQQLHGRWWWCYTAVVGREREKYTAGEGQRAKGTDRERERNSPSRAYRAVKPDVECNINFRRCTPTKKTPSFSQQDSRQTTHHAHTRRVIS